ncbi:MAG: UDP-N-acetylmuramate--L-alanine ligase, partial [Deltaproteobacteria bacterium]|nr:UDP-N-acetylmuramate--L-alanine ligase [Deltaproteobacteria bacterium]
MFRGITRIHFVGIGGIGMSGIAELLLNLGFTISGSDVADSDTVQRLRSLGAVIHIGHRPENIGDAQVVVYSSAVKLDNPECAAARARTLPVIPRAEMLAELMRMKFSIAIAGTHGKTTTTSMLATILAMAGKDPTAVIGGRLDMFGSNARLGEGELLVAEADESDRSFLKLTPIVAVVTNIEEEHMDCYRDIDDIRDTYVQFLNKVPFFGFDMVCLDDANIQYILPLLERKVITYGSHTQAIYRYTEPRFSGLQTSFTAHRKGSVLGEISLDVPGKHNCLNALAAMGTALELGIDFEVIRRGLDEFKGVQRRCHVRGEKRGITVMDDYGHHPTEIRMTLSAIKNGFPKRRVIAVFQPHRYTRTRDLFDDFVNSFYDAGRLYVTEIYPASEQPIEGVSGRRLFEEIKNHGYRDAFFVEDKDDIPGTLQKVLKKGD